MWSLDGAQAVFRDVIETHEGSPKIWAGEPG
jgi:hypothetical protein